MLARAFELARGRRGLLLGLAVLNLLLTKLAAAPLSAALAPIDLRPAASAMLDGDASLAMELLAERPEILRAAAAGLLGPTLLAGLLAWLLAGAILDGRRGFAPLLQAGGEHAGKMLKIGAFGLLLRGIPLLMGAAAWVPLRTWWRSRGFFELVVSHLIVVSIFAVAWAWTSVALDAARALAIGPAPSPPLRPHAVPRVVGRGLRLAWRRSGSALAIALVSLLGWLLVALVHHAVTRVWPAPLTRLPLDLVAAIARAAVAVTTLTAAGLLATSAAPAAPPRTESAPPS